jgi:hypothetical protein
MKPKILEPSGSKSPTNAREKGVHKGLITFVMTSGLHQVYTTRYICKTNHHHNSAKMASYWGVVGEEAVAVSSFY